jgi:hypothetical protein
MAASKEHAMTFEEWDDLEFGEIIGPGGRSVIIRPNPAAICKVFDVVSIEKLPGEVKFSYYLDGTGKEITDAITEDEIMEWAYKTKRVFKVWEVPVYHDEEEYMKIIPPTCEEGTAEEINARRRNAFLESINSETIESYLNDMA